MKRLGASGVGRAEGGGRRWRRRRHRLMGCDDRVLEDVPCDVDYLDVGHGNTPLHFSCMMIGG